MNPEWIAVMKDAISEVLETMFYTMVDFDGRGEVAYPYCCDSRIVFKNDVEQTTLYFRVIGDFARVITANFLGAGEDEVQQEELEDALKEVANMVAGNFIARFPQCKWSLGIPAFRMIDEDEMRKGGEGFELPLFYLAEPVGLVVVEYERSEG